MSEIGAGLMRSLIGSSGTDAQPGPYRHGSVSSEGAMNDLFERILNHNGSLGLIFMGYSAIVVAVSAFLCYKFIV